MKFTTEKRGLLFICLCLFGCSNPEIKETPPKENPKPISIESIDNNAIVCTDSVCSGAYVGDEFIEGDDIAHQFSNEMSHKVGDHLKALYASGKYSKVDLSNIKMTAEGMGSGLVTYRLSIPIIRVTEKCEAYTSFDHCGGWDHPPHLDSRVSKLKTALLKGERLDISNLKSTPEGLQEYWIQWKNKTVQAECQ